MSEATVEVTEKSEEAALEAAPVAPSRDELKVKGWSAKELDAAEKRGMIAKPAEKKEEQKSKENEIEVKAEDKKEEVKPDPKAKQSGSLPDFTLNPEQEKVFLESFGPGSAPRALYFRMKNERHARQAIESRARELESQIVALKSVQVVPAETEQDDDLENQPLTLKQLKELQRQEAEVIERSRKEQSQRQSSVAAAQSEQEEYARSIYEDFDATVERAKDVMQNLDALFPDKWKQSKVVKLVRDLQAAAHNADKLGLDDYNAAMIAYEIGQLHPDHGTPLPGGRPKETGTSKDNPKGNGSLSPEQMKRVVENTQRRASSASVPGGSVKRTVSADNVTLAHVNQMSFAERSSFREKHPEQYAKLLRG